MKKLITIYAVLITLAVSAVCQADIFVVPLPVSGNYNCGSTQSFSFDLGATLSQVHSVSFALSGQITAGVDHSGYPFPYGFTFFFDTGSSSIWTHGPSGGVATYPNPEPFSEQTAFILSTHGNWNFLLDGSASGWVEFPAYITGGAGIGSPQSAPTGFIDSASLIIDATPTPEPATLLLLGLGGLFLRKRSNV